MRTQLVSFLHAIVSETRGGGLELQKVADQFDPVDLEAMEANGLYVIKRKCDSGTVRVSYSAVLDFLQYRYE